MLTRADVQRLARQARLDLSPDEVERLRVELSEVVAHMQLLAEVGVVTAPSPDEHVRLRPDRPDADPLRHQLAALAPALEAGFFAVPRVITSGPARDTE